MSRLNMSIVANGDQHQLEIIQQQISALFVGFGYGQLSITASINEADAEESRLHAAFADSYFIESVGLNTRIVRQLQRTLGKPLTVKTVRSFTRSELMAIPGIAKNAVERIEDVLGPLDEQSAIITERNLDVSMLAASYYQCTGWSNLLSATSSSEVRAAFTSVKLIAFARFTVAELEHFIAHLAESLPTEWQTWRHLLLSAYDQLEAVRISTPIS